MIKIQPSLRLANKNLVQKNAKTKLYETKTKNLENTKIDLSGEERGYYRVGDRLVKIIFPR